MAKTPKQLLKRKLSNLDKYVRSVSEDENSKVLCVSVSDGRIVINGDKVFVDIFKNQERISEMKVKDLHFMD